MIKYSLICEDKHAFESWFQSSDAFERLFGAGMVACPACGNSKVKKSMMAPNVSTSRSKTGQNDDDAQSANMHALAAPSSEAEAALQEFKKKVQENSEYVGEDFAKEARKIHEGDSKERSIYGEAKPDEARKLIDDGIPVAPLPFMPTRKSN